MGDIKLRIKTLIYVLFFTSILLIPTSSIYASPNQRTTSPHINLIEMAAVGVPITKLPSGTITTFTPTYIWTKIANTSAYDIQLYAGDNLVYDITLDAADCGPSQYCVTSPIQTLNSGSYKWKVRANISGVWKSFSGFKSFAISAVPATISPTGSINVSTPTFTWRNILGATKYEYQVYKGSKRVYLNTIDMSSTDPDYICSDTSSPVLAQGSYTWKVRALVGGAWKGFSKNMSFSVSALPYPITPTNYITDRTPTFTWTKTSGALFYEYSLSMYDSEIYSNIVYFSSCNASNNCVNTPNLNLEQGDYSWKVRAYVSGAWTGFSQSKDFTINLQTLTAKFDGSGTGIITSSPAGIYCSHDCTYDYSLNTVVTLTAIPDTNYVFSGWTGEGCSGKSTCTVTMSTYRSVTATFDLADQNLTVTIDGGGSGSITSSPSGINCGSTCSYDFPYNSEITLIATPDSASYFTGWSGCSYFANGNTCHIYLFLGNSVVANFIPATAYKTMTVPNQDGHTCGLTINGSVNCWGSNNFGQLGIGSYVDSNNPINVTGLSSGITAISAGENHTCAVTIAGSVVCWGKNNVGQLGDGTYHNGLTPVNVSGLSSGVTSLISVDDYTCALSINGSVKCWGNAPNGASNIPIEVIGLSTGVKSFSTNPGLSSYGHFACVLTTIGGVKCWGENYSGELGNNTYYSSNQAVDVIDLDSGVKEVIVGTDFACAITSNDGLKCWGNNNQGQLGNGTKISSNIPVDVIGLSSGVTQVSLGGYYFTFYTCAVVSGGVKCWGNNDYGQLGDGTKDFSVTPVSISGNSTSVNTVSANSSTCILSIDGEVKCWGYRYDNDAILEPEVVSGLTSDISLIFSGEYEVCSISNNGGLKCWDVLNKIPAYIYGSVP